MSIIQLDCVRATVSVPVYIDYGEDLPVAVFLSDLNGIPLEEDAHLEAEVFAAGSEEKLATLEFDNTHIIDEEYGKTYIVELPTKQLDEGDYVLVIREDNLVPQAGIRYIFEISESNEIDSDLGVSTLQHAKELIAATVSGYDTLQVPVTELIELSKRDVTQWVSAYGKLCPIVETESRVVVEGQAIPQVQIEPLRSLLVALLLTPIQCVRYFGRTQINAQVSGDLLKVTEIVRAPLAKGIHQRVDWARVSAYKVDHKLSDEQGQLTVNYSVNLGEFWPVER